jgi:hypothetical protein
VSTYILHASIDLYGYIYVYISIYMGTYTRSVVSFKGTLVQLHNVLMYKDKRIKFLGFQVPIDNEMDRKVSLS